MRINSGSSLSNKSARVSSQEAIEHAKERPIEKTTTSGPTSDALVNAQNLISREDLLALANDLKSGKINRSEANNQFIERVVDNSINNKLSDKDKETLTKAINHFFSDDQDFIRSLEKNLMNLV